MAYTVLPTKDETVKTTINSKDRTKEIWLRLQRVLNPNGWTKLADIFKRNPMGNLFFNPYISETRCCRSLIITDYEFWSTSKSFLTKRLLTDRFLTERVLNKCFLSEHFLTERYLAEHFLTEHFLIERFLTEHLLKERFLTERLFAKFVLHKTLPYKSFLARISLKNVPL